MMDLEAAGSEAGAEQPGDFLGAGVLGLGLNQENSLCPVHVGRLVKSACSNIAPGRRGCGLVAT